VFGRGESWRSAQIFRKETAMPKEGDTMTGYCKHCERETTWVYCLFMLGKDIWECKECGNRHLL
jgi:hypothetical protein